MTNSTLQIKIKQRLNKLASFDYDNIECWQVAEAFNKAQLEWVRRQLPGSNSRREGSEQSIRRIDDLQVLITSTKDDPTVIVKSYRDHVELKLPGNYLEYKRVSGKAKTDDCPERAIIIYLAQEADVDVMLQDPMSAPSFEWAETFATLSSNTLKIYTAEKFTLAHPEIIYYRLPREIAFEGCVSTADGTVFPTDIECEFKDDVTELILDEAASIIAGDLENVLQYQRGSSNAEKNN